MSKTNEASIKGSDWRAGRPIEDPDKIKRWGFVSAKPSEYLVHVRGGRVRTRSSGQGTTCFKWPWDSVAVVPTSLQQLSFCADQVTLERVGVEVRGFAVYRIAEPLLSYRVLNFSFPERAQEKLAESLNAMFVGGARRLIANLSVDDVLQRRKAALAEELLREIAPVVGGRGRPDEDTPEGWGVVLDTIEIQEVRVLSEKVFSAMQAPYRAALEQRAREARAFSDKEVVAKETEYRRAADEAKLAAARAVKERELASARAGDELRLANEQAIAELERQAALAEADATSALELRRVHLAAVEADAQLSAHPRRLEAMRVHNERCRIEAEGVALIEEVNAASRQKIARDETGIERTRAEIEQLRAEARARITLAEGLPQLAGALGQKMEVRVHQHGGSDAPFATILQAIESVVDLARRA